MPKRDFRRGRGFVHNNGERFSESTMHDDRDRKAYNHNSNNTNNIRRRVSFKPLNGPSGFNRNVKGKSFDLAIKTRIEEDEDMHEMAGNRSNLRVSDKNIRRRGSPIPKGFHGATGRKLTNGNGGWFLVTIPYGHKYEKEFILRQLLDKLSPESLSPYYYKIDQTSSSFYVDDIKTADLLLALDRQIQMPDGHRLIIKVRNQIPHVNVNETLKEKIKMAMVKRYSPATKALDLTKFHADPDLIDMFCALFRPTIMLAALEVISDNIPDLEALNLQDNKLYLLDHFRGVSKKLPNLKILHIANNRISSLHAMEALKECKLIDLVLQGNPLKDRMRDDTIYVSEIRRRFPKLEKLDGVILPQQISFDVTDSTHMPTPNASFLCDQSGADIVRQFLEQYFVIFDSNNRQPLLDAYHANAMLSLTATFASQQNQRLSSYLNHNRNLTRIRDIDLRMRQLKTGRLPVVSFLSELPATQHDPQSFAVDLTLFTPQLILLTVTGVFRELSKNDSKNNNNSNNNVQSLRSFQKTLVIVPAGGGFCIKNEMLHINNVTIAQSKMAFKQPTMITNNNITDVQQNCTTTSATTTIASPIQQQQQLQQQQQQQPPILSPQVTPTITQPQPIAVPDDNLKLQMIQVMAQKSTMNLEWSKKCLEQTNWDFDRAAFVFTELQKQNKIPAEAFVK